MKAFSTELTAVLVLIFTQILGQWFTDGTAKEVAVFVVAGLAALYLWFKRVSRGDVTPLGFRK